MACLQKDALPVFVPRLLGRCRHVASLLRAVLSTSRWLI